MADTGDFYDLFDRHPATPATPTSSTPTPGSSPYAEAALRREAAAVAAAPEGTRNDTLNRASFNLHQLVATGHLDDTVVHDALTTAAEAAGLDAVEIPATIDSGCKAGTQHPRTTAPQPLSVVTVAPLDDYTPANGHVDLDEVRAKAEAFRNQQIATEAERLRVRRQAERLVLAEEHAAAFREPPWRPTLTAELALVDEPIAYRVEEVLPAGGNVVMPAGFKTGKTTLTNDLARALVDGKPFLDRFPTHLDHGRVAVWNYEVDERQFRRWLRDIDITNTDAVTVLNLRGYHMPLTSPRIEDWIVAWLTHHETTVWFVDPFARAFVGSGSENDNSEVGVFLDTLDVIKERASVSELVLPTHTGRITEPGAERARGATRLDDWADARWILTADDRGNRFFRATGRDVDVAEEMLEFDPATRRLRLGGGDRRWEHRRHLERIIIDVVHQHPGIGIVALRAAVRDAGGKGRNETIDAAVNEAERALLIVVERPGNGLTSKHYPARSRVPT